MIEQKLNRLLVANLQRIMDEHGLNPSSWAKQANLSHTAVRDIISGKSLTPNYSTLIKLAKAVNVDVLEITIGKSYSQSHQAEQKLHDLIRQLKPDQQAFVLAAVEELLADQDQDN